MRGHKASPARTIHQSVMSCCSPVCVDCRIKLSLKLGIVHHLIDIWQGSAVVLATALNQLQLARLVLHGSLVGDLSHHLFKGGSLLSLLLRVQGDLLREFPGVGSHDNDDNANEEDDDGDDDEGPGGATQTLSPPLLPLLISPTCCSSYVLVYVARCCRRLRTLVLAK